MHPYLQVYLYAHIRTHVYIIICPCMHLFPYLCVCIYPCRYMQLCAAISICVYPGTDTHIPGSGHIQGWGYVYIYVQGYGWVYMGICRYAYVQVQTDTPAHTQLPQLYAPGTPLRGKRSGGGCQEQLNVCLIV